MNARINHLDDHIKRLEAAIKVAETLKTNTSVRYSSSFGIGILVKLGVISKPDPNYEVRLNLDV